MNRNHDVSNQGAACRAVQVTGCRGVEQGCVNALPVDEELLEALERAVAQSGLADMLARTLGKGARPHHALRINVAACPNGCSRPQVSDLGVLAAQRPYVDPEAQCTGCGECERACPDQAIRVVDEDGGTRPVIDNELCLECGLCVRACEFGVLAPGNSLLRLQVGGKLGRRPLLAAELSGRYGAAGAEAVLSAILVELMRNYRPGMRVADLRRRIGDAWLEELPCGS